jgi:CubicO group peptidase (beta-lactamase class C family)
MKNFMFGLPILLIFCFTSDVHAQVWVARHGMSSAKYQEEFDKYTKQGYRLTVVSGYEVNNQPRYAAIWEKSSGPAWVARHGMSPAKYQEEFDKFVQQGYRLTRVSGYTVGGKDFYAAIWEKTSGPAWVARHGMSSSAYQQEFDKYVYQGYKLVEVSGYSGNGNGRYAAIWESVGFKFSDLQHIDQTITGFMNEYDIPGLSIAIAKDGQLVFAKGYGFADKENKEETTISHLFRIASVSKPITSVSVMKLIEDGKLSLNDKIFGKGAVLGTQYGTTPYKANIEEITVQNLLEHTAGGWTNKSNDPMFSNPGFDHQQLISWVLDNQSLDNAPGSEYAYSNFGYCVLGRVIEKKSGQTYADFVKTDVLKSCGVSDMHIAGDTKAQRRPNEVVYYDSGSGNPYGMKVARMDAHGGWIASAIDLLRFAVRVDGFATKADLLDAGTIKTMTTPSLANKNYAKGWNVNQNNNWWHVGSLPGTASILVRADNGFCWAVLVNTRNDTDSFFSDLDKLTWNIIGGVSTWPKIDLF